MVARLMKLGYLERTRSPTDGRAWELRLTPKGRGALKRMGAPFRELNCEIADALGLEGTDEAARLLLALVHRFEPS